MNTQGKLRWVLFLAALLLLLLGGCKSKDGGSSAPPPEVTAPEAAGNPQSTALVLTIPTFARSDESASKAVSGQRSVSVVDGQLLVVPGKGDEKTYDWSLSVDESSFQITTSIVIDLDPGSYDFFFLLNSGVKQYAGRTANSRLVVEGGKNVVPIVLNPVIGPHLADVGSLRNLSAFAVSYDPTEIATYADPKVGITVNGVETVFSINPNSGVSNLYVFLPAGSYQISVRIYDGAFLRMKDSAPTPEETVTVGGSTPPSQIVLVPLTAGTTYTYTANQPEDTSLGTATFTFSIPSDVVTEAGGTGNLLTLASVAGPFDPLVEKALSLSPAGSGYSGTVTVTNFTPGQVSWSLSFFNKSAPAGSPPFATCAQTVVLPTGSASTSQSFICDLNLIVQSSPLPPSVAGLDASVSDSLGGVPGAAVLANGQIIGITGGGTAGTGTTVGRLNTFLSAGAYTLQASAPVPDPANPGLVIDRSSDAQSVSLNGGVINGVDFILPPPPPSDVTPPAVSSSLPVNNSTGVAVNTSVSVTFSESMEPTATQNAFSLGTIIGGTYTPVAGTLSWSTSHSVLTFKPNDALGYSRTYTYAVGTGARDLVGNALQAAYSASFTTGAAPDTTAPTVVSIAPGNGSTDVGIGTPIVVTFSEAMNAAATEGAFSLSPAASGGTSWSADHTALTFTPSPGLAYDTVYTVTIGTGATDTANNHLQQSRSVTFTTEGAPDLTPPTVKNTVPRDTASDVAVDTSISLQFSEAMNEDATRRAVSINPNANLISSWGGDGTVLTLTPTINLAYQQTYQVTVDTGAKDLAGNAMAAPFTFSFATGSKPDTESPTVLGTTPADTSTGVETDTTIVITFSEAMSPEPTEGAVSIDPAVDGSFSWQKDNTVLVFKPNSALSYSTAYTVTVDTEATDLAGNPLKAKYTAAFTTKDEPPAPPPAEFVIHIEASRQARPRVWSDFSRNLPEPALVLVPDPEDIAVTAGNPSRYVFLLSFGKVKCMYLGGKWDDQVGGDIEEAFEHIFKSPTCIGGQLNAGDAVYTEGPVFARVISADPHYTVTTVSVDLKVLAWSPNDKPKHRREHNWPRHGHGDDNRGDNDGHNDDHHD